MRRVAILGAGLSGLAAGYALARNGVAVTIFEADSEVGGASKTVTYKGFRFDLGGHRFYSKKEEINRFLGELMAGELIEVPRVSKVCLDGKMFNYPLTPSNAFFRMGPWETGLILGDYALSRLRNKLAPKTEATYRDWVVNRFGRILARKFFIEYAEKLWGIPSDRLSLDFASQRIKSLSLTAAIKNAFSPSSQHLPTLIHQFLYPRLGFGRIAERLAADIGLDSIRLNARVMGLNVSGDRVESVRVKCRDEVEDYRVDDVISTVPVTSLVKGLNPPPDDDVLSAAGRLLFRNMIFVFLAIGRSQVTPNTWMYFPEKRIPFCRIHEPKNWSRDMSPDGRTSLVVEYFCSDADDLWKSDDEHLRNLTVDHLARLGQIAAEDVQDSLVVRWPDAYPIYEMGYQTHLHLLLKHLSRFRNLQVIGRNGAFRYTSSDHYLDMGIKAAGNVLGEKHDLSAIGIEGEYAEE